MSQKSLEVVRGFNGSQEGKDLVPLVRALVERAGPRPDADAVLSLWADDPSWRHAHPEIEFDVTATGAFGAIVKGPTDVVAWWSEWLDAWESYVHETIEYRELGKWVLVVVDVKARGRGGIPVEMRVFQNFRVRDDRVDAIRAFLTEREALEAAGDSEENVEIYRRGIEAINRGDLEGALKHIHPDVVFEPLRSPVQGTYRGHRGFRDWFADTADSFDSFRIDHREVRDLGDDRLLAIGRLHVRGKGSGIETDVPTAGIVTIRDGRMIAFKDYAERAAALEAAGLSE